MRLLPSLLISLSLTFSPLAAHAEENAAAPTAALDEKTVEAIMTRAVDEVIRPGYRDFHASAGKLTAAMNTLCGEASAPAFDAAGQAFTDTIKAWSRIEIVRVGPVIEKNRFERILFYPDRKSTGLKQVQATLASADEKDTAVDYVATKSVAIQGLGALEYILHGTGAETLTQEKSGFRCRYGAAVAGNIETIAAGLVDIWEKPDGIQAAWKHPGPNNPEFRTGGEAITALLGILVHGVETVRDQRLEIFYKGSQPKPRSAIYWRSGHTFTSIAANLQGLKTLFDTSGIADLLPAEKKSVAGEIDTLLDRLLTAAPTVDADVAKAVETPAERQKIELLLAETRDLILRLNDDLGGAIGLTAGFSFSDGD